MTALFVISVLFAAGFTMAAGSVQALNLRITYALGAVISLSLASAALVALS